MEIFITMFLIACMIPTGYGSIGNGAKAKLEIRLHNFQNLLGRTRDGSCCDTSSSGGFIDLCGRRQDTCDTYFKITVNMLNNNGSSSLLHFAVNGISRNMNSIGSPSHTRNLTIQLPQLIQTGYEVRIEVYDEDELVDDLIAFWRFTVFYKGIERLHLTADRDISMNLTVEVVCAANYYGPDCTTYCNPNLSNGYIVRCDPQTGAMGSTGRYYECVNGFSYYRNRCDCRHGYTGSSCETSINDCLGVDCGHGSCMDRHNSYVCKCHIGYAGRNCMTDINDCQRVNCNNHGTCVDNFNSYTCTCSIGFTGVDCETNIDDCISVDCGHGQCTDLVDSYRCECDQGYAGSPCEADIDYCEGVNCKNGSCVEGIGSYQCQCWLGFTGRHCDSNINDCLTVECNTGICQDLIAGFQCNCQPGYTGQYCDTDIDDCFLINCGHGDCVDLVNSYCCDCTRGYTGSHCEIDINDCEGVNCNNGFCIDNIDDYRCHCSDGFSGQHCNVNIDDCHSINCNNGSCLDLVAGFLCHCLPGFTGQYCSADIDDCPSSDCQNGRCIDLVNTYRCECDTGFAGEHCDSDIDDCDGVDCTNGTCVDGISDYECHCSVGFSGRHCERNIDDCSSDPCYGAATCIDHVGSFTCQCPIGYDGILCAENPDNCAGIGCHFGECVDGLGNFTCSCFEGFTGTYCQEKEKKCEGHYCQHGDCVPIQNLEINNTRVLSPEDQYNCTCTQGYSGRFCHENINECVSQPCYNNGTCIDGVYGYSCVCSPWNTGKSCEDNCTLTCVSGQGICSHSTFPPSCICYHGYSGDNCQTEINECESNPCERGQCIDKINSYECFIDISCTKNQTFREELASSSCRYALKEPDSYCNTLNQMYDENTSVKSVDAECLKIHVLDCIDLSFYAAKGDSNTTVLCARHGNNTMMCEPTNLTVIEAASTSSFCAVTSSKRTAVVKYWYYWFGGGLALLFLGLVTITTAWCKYSTKRKMELGLTRSLPSIPSGGQTYTGPYEMITYANPSFSASTGSRLSTRNDIYSEPSFYSHRMTGYSTTFVQSPSPTPQGNTLPKTLCKAEYYTEPIKTNVSYQRSKHRLSNKRTHLTLDLPTKDLAQPLPQSRPAANLGCVERKQKVDPSYDPDAQVTDMRIPVKQSRKNPLYVDTKPKL